MALDRQTTAFGRGSANHVQYPHSADKSVLKLALWVCHLKARLTEGGTGMIWRISVPVVNTFARRHIWIDGVKLIKATDYCHFGYLHTRDVITIVERVYANAMEDSKDAYLEFRCQFWTGPSA